MDRLFDLHEKFRKTPFPKLGKVIGNFGLYDGYFEGYLQAALDGQFPADVEALEPDDESKEEISKLRAKPTVTNDEKEFLDYVALMDEIRVEIQRLAR